MVSGGEAILFWCLAPLMVLAALGLVFARKAVHATMCVVFVMVSLAVMYVALEAPFLGIVQIVVYTGAVMMLFLFVIMLVGVDASDSLVETIKGQRLIGWLAGLGLAAVLIGVVARAVFPKGDVGFTPVYDNGKMLDGGDPALLARVLFSDFAFDLEIVGVLLITAALAALTLTHKARLTPHIGQKEKADARVASGESLVPLPAPGVYAQRNAMDVPALDPQGQPIEASVSRILRLRGQERGAPIEDELPMLTEQKAHSVRLTDAPVEPVSPDPKAVSDAPAPTTTEEER